MLTLKSEEGVYWRSDDKVVIRGVEYYVTFERGSCEPCMKLSRSKLSGYIDGKLIKCECSFAEFAFGSPYICDGVEGPGGPCGNAVTIRVEWVCCEKDGWGGPGWYCARPVPKPGEDPVDCVAVELPEYARCDTSIEICSGPYADEESAVAACDPAAPELVGECCSGEPAAKRFRFMLTDITSNSPACDAACAALNGVWQTVEWTWHHAYCSWEGAAAFGSACWVNNITLSMRRIAHVVTGIQVAWIIELYIYGFLTPNGVSTYAGHNNEWDCKSPITLIRLWNEADFSSPPMCDNLPASITLYPF